MSLIVPLLSFVPLLNPVKAIQSAVKGAFEWAITNFTNGLFDVINYFVAGEITQNLLLLDTGSHNLASASTYPGLAEVYSSLTAVYFATLALSIISTALTRMFFPNNPRTSFVRLGERYLVATLVVGAFGPLIWHGIFEVHHAVGQAIWESGGGSGFEFRLQDEMFDTTSSIASLIGVAMILIYVGSSVILTILGFWIVLGIRVVILATAYALTPVWLALWAPDVGIGKYANLASQAFYGFVVVLLFLGLLIATILSTGGALIDQQGTVSDTVIQTSTQPADDQSSVTGQFQSPTHVSDSPLNFVFPIFVWAGSIWVAIMATLGLLGGVLSSGVGGGSAGAGQTEDSNTDTGDTDDQDAGTNTNANSDPDEGTNTGQDTNTNQHADQETSTDSGQADATTSGTSTGSETGSSSPAGGSLAGKATVAGGRAKQFAGRQLESVSSDRLSTLGEQMQSTSVTESAKQAHTDATDRVGQLHTRLKGEQNGSGGPDQNESESTNKDESESPTKDDDDEPTETNSRATNEDTKTPFQAGYSKAATVGAIAARGAAIYGKAVAKEDGIESFRYLARKGRQSDVLSGTDEAQNSQTDSSSADHGNPTPDSGNENESSTETTQPQSEDPTDTESTDQDPTPDSGNENESSTETTQPQSEDLTDTESTDRNQQDGSTQTITEVDEGAEESGSRGQVEDKAENPKSHTESRTRTENRASEQSGNESHTENQTEEKQNDGSVDTRSTEQESTAQRSENITTAEARAITGADHNQSNTERNRAPSDTTQSDQPPHEPRMPSTDKPDTHNIHSSSPPQSGSDTRVNDRSEENTNQDGNTTHQSEQPEETEE